MRLAFVRVAIGVLLVFGSTGNAAFAQPAGDRQASALYLNEPRVALVIGNGSYAGALLRSPANDAAEMAQLLRELGFKVTLRVDGPRS